EEATPFDVQGVELGHHEGKCSFEAIVAKYGIDDPAIHLLAEIVHGADVAHDLYGRPEAPGLKAIAEGFRYLGLKNDYEILWRAFFFYDPLPSYCHPKGSQKQEGGLIARGVAWLVRSILTQTSAKGLYCLDGEKCFSISDAARRPLV